MNNTQNQIIDAAIMIVDTEGKTNKQLKNEVYNKINRMFDTEIHRYVSKNTDNYLKLYIEAYELKQAEMSKILAQLYIQIDEIMSE